MSSITAAMSTRKNIAAAVRQSSLSRSSRMGELLDRFESGMACGTPDDIDFLIDEIVQRIEERLLRRIEQLPDQATSTPGNTDNGGRTHQADTTRTLKRPRRVVCDDTLRHEARLLVAQIMNIVKRRFEGKTTSPRGKTQQSMASSKIAREQKCVRPQVIKKYNEKMNRRADPCVRETCKRDEVITRKTSPSTRPVYQDGDTADAATTYSLRRAAKSSLRRYSVTGNVKALLRAGEWAKNDDFHVLSVPTQLTTPLSDNIEMLLGPCYEPPIEDHRFCDETPCMRESPTAPLVLDAKPQKKSMKSEKSGNFLNSSYTYARRTEIKKALPKFLTARCCDAMMTMFNAIRVAMAEQDVENLDYVDLLAGLIDTSKETDTKSAKKPTIKRCYPSVDAPKEYDSQERQKESHITGDSREMDPKLPRKSRDRLVTRQSNFGTLGTYTLRKATRSCLGHMLQRGTSYNALLMMTRNIRVGQTDEEFWEQTLDLDLDEATRKEVISDLVEFTKHARADTSVDKTEYPARSSRKITPNVDRTEFVDEDEITTRQSGNVDTQFTRHVYEEETDARNRSGGGVIAPSHTNYRYGMHRSLRRILPKFTGRRPYSALMHYANNIITDAQQDLICDDQFVPTINVPASRDAHAPQQSTQRKDVEKDSHFQPKPFALDRSLISSRIIEETETKDDGESFYDAYSWVSQPLSDSQQIPSENKQQRPQHDKDQDDHRWQDRYDDDKDGDEDDFFPADHIDEDTATDDTSPACRDDSGMQVSNKRSVRFADGIQPGDSDENGGEQVSQFFQKLGYYERVGSGELLHKTSQKKVKKTQDTTAASQTNSQEEAHAERPPSESQANSQQMEKPATLCNCL